ncbi:MAG: hypothetical protein A3F11_11800 [Gammaproteobacteria bacterium RIFCSPHIGHO2_12_FULL_37_14]|nr:MAG: hypothetical protein A3F11_11800 [Gammaproteobacteria bacterium RIFCSPHIGHO2_12_FULL_37_14]
MQAILTVIAIVTLIYLLLLISEISFGFHFIKNLLSQAILPSEKLPAISIIFSARNEERHLPNAIRSMRSLNYPNFEIVAINDRSTDNTNLILKQFENDVNFKTKYIQTLPKGWLGKNYALHTASQLAKNEWLLFTDADVVMKEDLVAKAISYVINNNIDHLTIYENHINKGFWLKILLLANYITYSMKLKPWRIKYTWSKKYLGHGAFNLVKKSSYLKCGGHHAIAMECLDDLKLGALIKNNGFKQDIVNGKNLIEREWYASLSEMVDGLKKNSFAFFNYSFITFFINFIFAFLFFIVPFIGIFIFQGLLQFINIVNITLTFGMALIVARYFQVQKYIAFFYPVGVLLLFYTLWNSVIAAYRHQGIIWRDTYYSLQELRNRNVLDNDDC